MVKIMIGRSSRLQRYAVEEAYEYRKWRKDIPPLSFPQDWKIRIIPPFGGALIRFIVVSEFGVVSVYLDAYDELGCMNMEPYWEIYPGSDEHGSPDRFQMNDIVELIEGIRKAINLMKPKDVL
jgi:hypothetical protein